MAEPATNEQFTCRVGCNATYPAYFFGRKRDEKFGGFIANVTIRVETAVSTPIIQFEFPGDQTITNMWGSTYTQSGSSVTVVNEGWNGNIGPGGGTHFGFQASSSGSNDIPTNFSLNGQVCD